MDPLDEEEVERRRAYRQKYYHEHEERERTLMRLYREKKLAGTLHGAHVALTPAERAKKRAATILWNPFSKKRRPDA